MEEERFKECFDLEQIQNQKGNIWKTSAAECHFFFKEDISKSGLKEMALEFLGILYRGSNRDGFLIKNCQGYFSQKCICDM